MKVQIIALLLGLLLLSCNEESQKEKLVRLVNEWQGKEIKFPTDPIFTRYIKDTTDFQLPTKGHKVLIYVDSTGCVDCKLQLKKWKEFITYIDSVTDGSVPFLFFFHSKNIRETAAILKGDKFNYPVCVDRSDRLNKLNGFPSDIRFQTFLLDGDNKVAVLGNPIHNLSVKDLYIRELTEKSSNSSMQHGNNSNDK